MGGKNMDEKVATTHMMHLNPNIQPPYTERTVPPSSTSRFGHGQPAGQLQPIAYTTNASPGVLHLFQSIGSRFGHHSTAQDNDDDEEDNSEIALKRRAEERQKALTALDPKGKSIQSFPVLRPNPLIDSEEEEREMDNISLSNNDDNPLLQFPMPRNDNVKCSPRLRPTPVMDTSLSASAPAHVRGPVDVEAHLPQPTIYSSAGSLHSSSSNMPEPASPPGPIPEISISFASPTPPTSRPMSQQEPLSFIQHSEAASNILSQLASSPPAQDEPLSIPETTSQPGVHASLAVNERSPSIFRKLASSIMARRSYMTAKSPKISSLVTASQKRYNSNNVLYGTTSCGSNGDPWDSCDDMLASDPEDASAPATPTYEEYSINTTFSRDGRPLSAVMSHQNCHEAVGNTTSTRSIRFSLPLPKRALEKQKSEAPPGRSLERCESLKSSGGRVRSMDALIERSMCTQHQQHENIWGRNMASSSHSSGVSKRRNHELAITETSAIHTIQSQDTPPATSSQNPSVRSQWQTIAANRQHVRLVQETFDPDELRTKPIQRAISLILDNKTSSVKSAFIISSRYPVHTNPIATTTYTKANENAPPLAKQNRSSTSSTSSGSSSIPSIDSSSTPPPPLAMSLQRSLTTACVFGHYSPDPPQKQAPAAMVPTIVIPPRSALSNACAQSATTINSASSSATLVSSASDSHLLYHLPTASRSTTSLPVTGLLKVPPAEGRPLFNRHGGTTHFHGQSHRTRISAVAAAAMAATSRARREGIWSSAPHIGARQHGYHQMESDEDEDSDYSDEKLRRMYPLASSSTSTINSTVSFASTAAPLAAPSSTYNFGDEKLLRYAMYGSDEYISLGDRHHDQELRQLDADEKFLQLPDPSPFEGVCTCRGIVNIMGIVTVLIGLILLILGYPIARFSHLDRGATELAPSLPMNASSHLPPAFIASSALGSGDPESADMLLGEFLQGITGEGSQRPRVSRAKTLMIDPDTPMNQRTRVAIDGSEWHLVFSDEFNREGRSFGPGQDPHWEAVELRSQEHGSDDPVEDYARDAITTKGGHLEIQLSREEVHDSQLQKRQDDKALLKYKYTSGMLQSWNKLCFQGGILEVSVSFPSVDNAHVLKPRVFALGNLARYGFMSTMDGVWPYSYSTCDVETHLKLNRSNSAAEASTGSTASSAQRLNACLQHRSKDSPSPGVGRGAPQIDLLEVYQSSITEPTSMFAQNSHTRMAKRDSKKSQEYSLTKQQRLIGDDGSRIVAAQHLHTSKTLVSFPHERYSTLSQMEGPQAGGVGSRYSTAVSSLTVAAPSLTPPGDKMSIIASDGANVTTIQQLSMIQHEDPLLPVSSPLSKQVHTSSASVSSSTESGTVQASSGYVSVAVEYWPKITQYEATNATDAYLRFMVNNSWHHPIVESTFNSSAKSSSPIAEARVSPGAAGGSTAYMYTNSAQMLSEGLLIPQEPMSIVLSLGLFHQSHDSLGQQSSHHATAEESLHAILSNPALKWPIVMKVDYVRLYQPTQALIADSEKAAGSRPPAFKASTALSCDPFDHPTARYIQDHPAAYTDASKKTWAEAGYQSPAL